MFSKKVKKLIMIFYIRKIKKYNWEVEKKDQLCGDSITIDLRAEKNEWSVFKVDVSNIGPNDPNIEKVILHLFSVFPLKNFDCISIVLIDEPTLRKFNINMPEDETLVKSEVIHMNINNINFIKMNSGMDMIIDIVNKQKNKIFSYTIVDVYNIITRNHDFFSEIFKGFNKEKKQQVVDMFKNYGFKQSDYDN